MVMLKKLKSYQPSETQRWYNLPAFKEQKHVSSFCETEYHCLEANSIFRDLNTSTSTLLPITMLTPSCSEVIITQTTIASGTQVARIWNTSVLHRALFMFQM